MDQHISLVEYEYGEPPSAWEDDDRTEIWWPPRDVVAVVEEDGFIQAWPRLANGGLRR